VTTVTIDSVKPARGHTGGRTLVEITGSGFRTPPEPDLNYQGVLPAPPTLVRVMFGDTPARKVVVAGEDLLWAESPIHDPGEVDVTVQNLGETPARVTTTSANSFALETGQSLTLKVGGELQTITVGAGDVATSGAATPAEVAAFLNRALGVRALTLSSGRVQLETDARGVAARLELIGGSALAPLTLTAGIYPGSATLEPIAEQSATAADAYEFVRPRLDIKVPLALAFEQFITELERQVLDNVNVATHTDYDPETGDELNTAAFASLPAIQLVNIELVPSTSRQALGLEEHEGSAPDRGTERAPVKYEDITMTVIGVSDNPAEMLALHHALRGFFQKNPKLEVAPDHLGDDGYDLDWQLGTPSQISFQQDNSNLCTVTGSCAIRGVESGGFLLGDEGPLPDGAAPNLPYEGTRGLTWNNQQTNVVMRRKG
jgi:hypothetical protein